MNSHEEHKEHRESPENLGGNSFMVFMLSMAKKVAPLYG